MSRYIVESLTDPRAKITAQTWGNVTDIVAPVKQFLQASALQQLTISPDVLILSLIHISEPTRLS